MDIGVFREDEQFIYVSSAYVECYSSDSASFQNNALFGEIRPMPEPPNEIFEWPSVPSDADDKTLNTDASEPDIDETEYIYAPTEYAIVDNKYASCGPTNTPDDHQYTSCVPKNEPDINDQIWSPVINNVQVEQIPADVNYIGKNQVQLKIEPVPTLQEILDLPEIKDNCDSHIATSISEFSDDSTTDSEYSDLLNTSFSSTELTNFDIAKYMFEEDKQVQKHERDLLAIKNEPVTFFESELIPEQNVEIEREEPVIVKIERHEPVNVKIEIQEHDIVKIESQELDIVKKVNFKEEPKFEKNIDIKPAKRVVKAGVKKIDLKAKKYIVQENEDAETRKKSISEEDCDVDIETVTEGESSLIIEAGNLTDLLEQFEATVESNKDQVISNNKKQVDMILDVKIEKDKAKTAKKVEKKTEFKKLLQKKKENDVVEPEKIEQPVEANISQEQLCASYTSKRMHAGPTVKTPSPPTSSKASEVSSNRQNINLLPQDLINRIKESGKRKPITVIEPFPNIRKRMKTREPIKCPPPTSINKAVLSDHNYCNNIENSSSTGLDKNKCEEDSSFHSGKHEKSVHNHQPTVKTVSLLKVHSIKQQIDDDPTNQKKKLSIEEYKERKNTVTSETQTNTSTDAPKNQKRKLNLEEYKKRKNGIITPKTQSLNCSPATTTCSSPSQEDDYEKMLKHQQKLKKMAEELLKAAPKSEKKTECSGSSPLTQVGPTITKGNAEVGATINNNNNDKEIVEDIKNREIKLPKLPPNLERKILVSFGVNTDFSIAKNEDPLAPIENLQEIKPLLEKVSNRINENSLIISVIENVPILIDRNLKKEEIKATMQEKSEKGEHGEHKKILYLEKDRVRPETRDAKVQTNISLIDQGIRRLRKVSSSSNYSRSYHKSRSSSGPRRRRNSSNSSCSSRTSYSSRSTSPSSYYSSSDSSSNSSRLSYCRPRSRSPAYKRTRHNSEHLNAVEERRIIYVGQINSGTTEKELRRKFQKFGPINRISLHFREIGENYGFVTFKYKEDAHAAYEHGNDDPGFAYYKISFGGRRDFCKSAYSDLDNVRDDSYYQSHSSSADADYDQLLQEALKKLKKRNA